jgi:hypothetical protein
MYGLKPVPFKLPLLKFIVLRLNPIQDENRRAFG